MKPFELDEKLCSHKYEFTLDCRCPGCGKQFPHLKVVQEYSWSSKLI